MGCCALVIIVACSGVVYAVNKIDGNNEILCEVEEDDSLVEVYRNMIQQRESVVKSLR